MYREEDYYRELFLQLEKYHLNTINRQYKLILDRKIEIEYKRLNYNEGVIEACEVLIGKKIKSIIPFHAMLYKLFRRDFGLRSVPSITELAIDYTLLGCILDKLIDDNCNENNICYIELLKVFSLGKLIDDYGLEKNSILNLLLHKINSTYLNLAHTFSNLNSIIIDLSKKAIESEIFVSEHNIYNCNYAPSRLIVDKSDKFTMVGLLMAVMDVDVVKLDDVQICAQLIGKIILLTDDLSDLYEDIKSNQINSLIYNTKLHVQNLEQLETAIDIVIESLPEYIFELDTNITQLKQYLSSETIDYIHFLIVNWLNSIIVLNENSLSDKEFSISTKERYKTRQT